MKRNTILIAAVVLAALLTISLMTIGIFSSGDLNPRGDWSFPLENGYEVWQINSREIVICWREDPEKASASTVIGSYVAEIAMADGWLCAKQLTSPQGTAAQYYLLDMGEKTLFGPYETQAALEAQRKDLSLTQDLTWIDTSALSSRSAK